MKRMHELFSWFSEKDVLVRLLSELPEKEWDDWIGEYYGMYLYLRKCRKMDVDYVLISMEPQVVDDVDTYSVCAFEVDKEVFDLQEKKVNIKQVSKIMNMMVPQWVRQNYGELNIVCGILRAMCEDFSTVSREKQNEELFEEVREELLSMERLAETSTDTFLEKLPKNNLKLWKTMIEKECEEMRTTSFYTISFMDLIKDNSFSEAVYRNIDPGNPPNMQRCRMFHERLGSRHHLLRSRFPGFRNETIVITDLHLNEGDIPYVYVEGNQGEEGERLLASDMELFTSKIKVKMLRNISRQELLALICMYILYPIRMERIHKMNGSGGLDLPF